MILIQKFQKGKPIIDRSLMDSPSNPSETSNQPKKENPYKKAVIQNAKDEKERLAYIEQEKQKEANKEKVRARIKAQHELDLKRLKAGESFMPGQVPNPLWSEDVAVEKDIKKAEYQKKIKEGTNEMMLNVALGLIPIGELAQGVKYLGKAATKEAGFLANRWGNMAGNVSKTSKEIPNPINKLIPKSSPVEKSTTSIKKEIDFEKYKNFNDILKKAESHAEKSKGRDSKFNPDPLKILAEHGKQKLITKSELVTERQAKMDEYLKNLSNFQHVKDAKIMSDLDQADDWGLNMYSLAKEDLKKNNISLEELKNRVLDFEKGHKDKSDYITTHFGRGAEKELAQSYIERDKLATGTTPENYAIDMEDIQLTAEEIADFKKNASKEDLKMFKEHFSKPYKGINAFQGIRLNKKGGLIYKRK
jgi:hypothetical protein